MAVVASRSRLRKLALWASGAVALYAVLGFFVAPLVVRYVLQRTLSEELGRQITVERVRINPFTLAASIHNFELKERDGSTTAVAFEDFAVDVRLSSLFRVGVIVEAASLVKPYVHIVRFADDTYSFQDIVDRLNSAPAAAPVAPPAAPPGPSARFALYNLRLSGGRIDFDDRLDKAQHSVTDLEIGLPFVSSLPGEVDIVVQPRLGAKVNGTPFELIGETKPFKDTSETTVRIDIDNLELAKYLAYAPLPHDMRVPSGRLNTRLMLSSTAIPGNRLQTLILSGTASLRGLKVLHADGSPLASLGELSVDLESLDLLKRRAAVKMVRVRAPEVDITRRKDGTLDLPAAPPATTAAPPAKPADEPPFLFTVAKIALSEGNVRFVDRTPPQPVALALNNISLTVDRLSNAPGSSADVALKARVNRAAPLEVAGKLGLQPVALDLKLSARNIELAPMSPYSAIYAGYGIAAGRLSLSHAYVIQDRNLAGKNDVSLDQFRFGDKVDSPTATSLPVPLAVALLKDRNGLIEVNLPISGSLDDPQLALGDLITHEVVTLIEHAIASPFALLGSRFGGGNDIAFLEFAAGTATLDAAGEAKLKTLARALYERPGLKLDVSGRAHPGADGAELAARAAAAQQVKASEAKGEATPTGVAAKSDEVKITEEELRQLAQSRAQAAKDWLVESGGISAERISIAAPTMGVEGIKDKGGPTRVDFSLR